MNMDLRTMMLIVMIMLSVSITLMIANRINDILNKDNKSNEETPSPTPLNMTSCIEASSKQLQFIDFTVLSLLQIRVSNSLSLNQPIMVKNIDIEVRTLSEDVMKALKEDFFKNPNSLYSSEFLMKYMIDKCKTSLIEAMRQSHSTE